MASEEAVELERLYDLDGRLREAKDKAAYVEDYEAIISAAKWQSDKAKQLAAQLIPRYFKYFPALATRANAAMFDLVENEFVATRIHAIRGFPLLGEGTETFRIAYVLGQLLTRDENVERDAVHKALMSLIRQDIKRTLGGLFKHLESVSDNANDSANDNVRDKVICFLKDKVFPLKSELLKPQAEMERYVTDLVKKSLHDVTLGEFKLFIDFLKSLSIFGDGASRQSIQELMEIVEAQADLDAQFKVSDDEHISRLIECMSIALPIFVRGAPSSKFLSYFNKQIVPVFDKLPEEKKLQLLKTVAVSSPYATAQDSRQLLSSIVQSLKKYMPGKKFEDINYTYVECLLYTFHQLAHKTPNSTNSICGYKIVTGQPSDRLGEDFSSNYKDFTERLSATEETVRSTLRKLNQSLAEQNKALSMEKSEEAKAKIKAEQQKLSEKLRSCNNILSMTQPLHAKSPTFIGDKQFSLSWIEPVKKATPPSTTGVKRPNAPTNGAGAGTQANKKQQVERTGAAKNSQLMNRALEGLSSGTGAGRRGRHWGGRRRGNR